MAGSTRKGGGDSNVPSSRAVDQEAVHNKTILDLRKKTKRKNSMEEFVRESLSGGKPVEDTIQGPVPSFLLFTAYISLVRTSGPGRVTKISGNQQLLHFMS